MSAVSSSRVWLITGSSSGFGRLIAEIALSKGDRVIATLRKPEALKDLQDRTSENQLLVLKTDVTNQEEVTSAFIKGKEKFGRIDVVCNNAGYGMGSLVESTPEDAARAIFETNFWGAARVSREAVRFFRDENPVGLGGRLMVISSYAGLNALPSLGYYGATKHALEAVTQAMAQELDSTWNIKVSLVEPGTFRTPVLNTAVRLPIPEVYLTPTSGLVKVQKLLGHIDKPETKLGDPQKAAAKIYELSTLPDPPFRLILAQDAIRFVRMQLDSISADLEKYRSWSDDLAEE